MAFHSHVVPCIAEHLGIVRLVQHLVLVVVVVQGDAEESLCLQHGSLTVRALATVLGVSQDVRQHGFVAHVHQNTDRCFDDVVVVREGKPLRVDEPGGLAEVVKGIAGGCLRRHGQSQDLLEGVMRGDGVLQVLAGAMADVAAQAAANWLVFPDIASIVIMANATSKAISSIMVLEVVHGIAVDVLHQVGRHHRFEQVPLVAQVLAPADGHAVVGHLMGLRLELIEPVVLDGNRIHLHEEEDVVRVVELALHHGHHDL
eukprot:s3968_g4.t2